MPCISPSCLPACALVHASYFAWKLPHQNQSACKKGFFSSFCSCCQLNLLLETAQVSGISTHKNTKVGVENTQPSKGTGRTSLVTAAPQFLQIKAAAEQQPHSLQRSQQWRELRQWEAQGQRLCQASKVNNFLIPFKLPSGERREAQVTQKSLLYTGVIGLPKVHGRSSLTQKVWQTFEREFPAGEFQALGADHCLGAQRVHMAWPFTTGCP